MKSYIKAISYHLPEKVLSNEDLAREFPDLKIDDLTRLTGVKKRHIAAEDETAADLAYKAALRLFEEHNISSAEIDHVIFCVQGSDPQQPVYCRIALTYPNMPDHWISIRVVPDLYMD